MPVSTAWLPRAWALSSDCRWVLCEALPALPRLLDSCLRTCRLLHGQQGGLASHPLSYSQCLPPRPPMFCLPAPQISTPSTHPPPQPHPSRPSPAPQRRIELVDSYARVIAMIEIEVEMDADLPAAEVLGECACCACLRCVAAGAIECAGCMRGPDGAGGGASFLFAGGACAPLPQGAGRQFRAGGPRCGRCLTLPGAALCAASPPSPHPTPTHSPNLLAGIEEQILRLTEIESLQEEWQIQVGPAGRAGLSQEQLGAEARARGRWHARVRQPATCAPAACLPCGPSISPNLSVSGPSTPQAEAQDEVERLLRSSAV